MTLIVMPVMTLTESNIHGKFASSYTGALNTTEMGTPQTNAGPGPVLHPQLNRATFNPVTPLKPD